MDRYIDLYFQKYAIFSRDVHSKETQNTAGRSRSGLLYICMPRPYPNVIFLFCSDILKGYWAICNEVVWRNGSIVKHSDPYHLSIVNFRREFLVPTWFVRFRFRASPSYVSLIHVDGNIRVNQLRAFSFPHVQSSGESCRLQIVRLANFQLHRSVEEHHLDGWSLAYGRIRTYRTIRPAFGIDWMSQSEEISAIFSLHCVSNSWKPLRKQIPGCSATTAHAMSLHHNCLCQH